MSNLSILAVALGVGVGAPQLYGIVNPGKFATAVRGFSRSFGIGVVLMLVATAWFLWNVSQESIADFASYKNVLLMAFAAIGIGSCIFVRDFLAARGVAVLFLLLAKLMVDTGRPMLPQTSWTLVIQIWAYLLVLLGMWFTVSPWRLRDFLNWATASEQRIRIGCGIRLAFGLFIVLLALAKF